MANIYVKTIWGQSASIGQIQPVIGMVTDYGTIMGISGSLINIGSGNGQSHQWMYDYELSVLSTDMTGNYGWATGVTCTVFDRDTAFPNGFVTNYNSMTGISYYDGQSVKHTTR